MEEILALIGAAGALGTAASGIVETFKDQSRVGGWGSGQLKPRLGAGWALLVTVYGKDLDALIDGSFRKGPETLTALLRAGLRLAL